MLQLWAVVKSVITFRIWLRWHPLYFVIGHPLLFGPTLNLAVGIAEQCPCYGYSWHLYLISNQTPQMCQHQRPGLLSYCSPLGQLTDFLSITESSGCGVLFFVCGVEGWAAILLSDRLELYFCSGLDGRFWFEVRMAIFLVDVLALANLKLFLSILFAKSGQLGSFLTLTLAGWWNWIHI